MFNNYEICGDITIIFIQDRLNRTKTLIDTKDLQELINLNYYWY
jgi:hypothetical protein